MQVNTNVPVTADNDTCDLHGADAENEVVPVRDSIEVELKRKSSLLTVSQMFTDSSRAFRLCICSFSRCCAYGI